MRYSIGLQSGATDGAVSWGMLDRLLEDERIEFDGVSGASSGSVNTLMLGYGLALGGRAQAREMLERFWHQCSLRAGIPYSSRAPANLLFGFGSLDWLPQFWANAAFIQSTSPYFWNPLGVHLIREVMEELVEFERLRNECPIKLFISSTDVLRAKARIFRNHELTPEIAAASTNLPLYIPAQRIDDTYFWDGGFVGAPKLQPLIEECTADDIIFIRISPVERPQVPRTAFAIIERSIELAIAAGLDEELKRIKLLSHLIEEGRLQPGPGIRAVRFHHVEGTKLTRDLPFSGKYNMDWHFLRELRDWGRELAAKWLDRAPHVAAARALEGARARLRLAAGE
jgi:NTE family protein